jgi:hypothetical protein
MKRNEKIRGLVDEILFLNSDSLEILPPSQEEPKDALAPINYTFENNGIKYTIDIKREKA